MTQMLAVTAMEPPGKFEPEAIRNEKAKVLQASKLADENEPWNCCIRGQYGEGEIFQIDSKDIGRKMVLIVIAQQKLILRQKFC